MCQANCASITPRGDEGSSRSGCLPRQGKPRLSGAVPKRRTDSSRDPQLEKCPQASYAAPSDLRHNAIVPPTTAGGFRGMNHSVDGRRGRGDRTEHVPCCLRWQRPVQKPTDQSKTYELSVFVETPEPTV